MTKEEIEVLIEEKFVELEGAVNSIEKHLLERNEASVALNLGRAMELMILLRRMMEQRGYLKKSK